MKMIRVASLVLLMGLVSACEGGAGNALVSNQDSSHDHGSGGNPLISDQDGSIKKGSDESKHQPVQGTSPEKPSCDEVGYRSGIRGMVVGSESVDPDGITCLEIKTVSGHYVLIRVSRKVFNKCIEKDRYNACAKR